MSTATAPTLTGYISDRWANDTHERRARLDEVNYRNRLRWANVMQAWPAALSTLVARRRAQGLDVGPHFADSRLRTIYSAVMGGTGEHLRYVLAEMVDEGEVDVMAPLLRRMWSDYRV